MWPRPDRFARQLAAFAAARVDVLGGWALEIDAAGVPGRVRRMPLGHAEILDSLWACPLIHPTVMFRREPILALGGYRTDLRRSEGDLWFRCAKAGLRFANLPEVLIRHRFDASSHLRHAFRDALAGALRLSGGHADRPAAVEAPGLFRPVVPFHAADGFAPPVYRLLSASTRAVAVPDWRLRRASAGSVQIFLVRRDGEYGDAFLDQLDHVGGLGLPTDGAFFGVAPVDPAPPRQSARPRLPLAGGLAQGFDQAPGDGMRVGRGGGHGSRMGRRLYVGAEGRRC